MDDVKGNEKTTITISRKLKRELQRLGRMGDTYEGVIWRLVEFYKRHGGERDGKEEGS